MVINKNTNVINTYNIIRKADYVRKCKHTTFVNWLVSRIGISVVHFNWTFQIQQWVYMPLTLQIRKWWFIALKWEKRIPIIALWCPHSVVIADFLISEIQQPIIVIALHVHKYLFICSWWSLRCQIVNTSYHIWM